MRIFLASAAALALAAGGAQAQADKKGGDPAGKPDAAAVAHPHESPNRKKAEQAGAADKPGRAESAPQPAAQGKLPKGPADAAPREADNAPGPAASPERPGEAERREQGPAEDSDGPGENWQAVRGEAGRGGPRSNARPVRRVVAEEGFRQHRETFDRDRRRSPIAGCPFGRAKKTAGCIPAGLARQQAGGFLGYGYGPKLFGLSTYGAGRYVYEGGYLMQLGSNGGIAGYIPLLGGALSVGHRWPRAYRSAAVPEYYADYYGLGLPGSYRFADNVIYRVDPERAAITSIAALLTGDDITVGQKLPPGYDIYNVPYSYRDTYFDTPAAQYRYSDGYLYRIDPETQIVAAAIELLA